MMTGPYFQNVVNESEERSYGEGAGEECDEAELDDDLQVLVEEEGALDRGQLKVLHKPRCLLLPLADLDADAKVHHIESWNTEHCSRHSVMIESTFPDQRDVVLHDLEDLLLAEEDHGHLDGHLHEAALRSALLLPEAEQPVVAAGSAGQSSLEEGEIENGTVEVDKLEEVTLESQSVVVVGLSPEQIRFISEVFTGGTCGVPGQSARRQSCCRRS